MDRGNDAPAHPVPAWPAWLRAMAWSVALLDRAVMVLCTLLLIAMVVLNGTEALGRNFGHSTLYDVQLSIALSTIVYFLGYLVLLNRNEDVTVGFFHERLPPRLMKAVNILIRLGAVVFFTVLLSASLSYYHLTSFMRSQVLPVAQSTTVLPIIIGAAACLWVAVCKTAITLYESFT